MRIQDIHLIYILTFCLFILYKWTTPFIDTCDRCVYNSCSSSFILKSCSGIQNRNIDSYFQKLNYLPNEIDKIWNYSEMYGKNMADCFNDSRQFCRESFCSSECKTEKQISNTKETDNIVTTIDSETTNNQKYYEVLVDKCISSNINVKDMYSNCILSPFKYDCITRYMTLASKDC
jgi:hypothetical protein